ncbi:MAG: hypothetical protein WCF61_01430 [Terriglobales bacterium]
MKLKSLSIITLLVLCGSMAFAQGSATLGFTSPGGIGLYCNFEQIQWGGSNNFYIQGVDNLEAGCYVPWNATVEGVKVAISAADGSPVYKGPVYAYADTLIDAFSGVYTGEQWFVITQLKPSKLLHDYGWVGYLGVSGYEFLDNYGYLSASYPGANASGKPIMNQTTYSGAKSEIKSKTIQK